jgi:uncharacterized metal-binding protein
LILRYLSICWLLKQSVIQRAVSTLNNIPVRLINRQTNCFIIWSNRRVYIQSLCCLSVARYNHLFIVKI